MTDRFLFVPLINFTPDHMGIMPPGAPLISQKGKSTCFSKLPKSWLNAMRKSPIAMDR